MSSCNNDLAVLMGVTINDVAILMRWSQGMSAGCTLLTL